MVGVSHRQIRQKFLIAFMEAAQRLNVPLQIMQNFCEDVDPAGRTGVLALALLALAAFAGTAFVSAPAQAEHATAELQTKARLDRATEMAILGAVAGAAPEVAHAGNSGYALLQLGWAVFIISLGPAVLFWVYFNKPELL
eukprot:s399_g2.t1